MADLQQQEICARIKEARTEAGLTQEAMAEALHIRHRTYWNYEDSRPPEDGGKGKVPYKLLGKIAKLTGKSTEWLLHGVDHPDEDQLAALDRKLDMVLELLSQANAEDLAKAFEAPRARRQQRGGKRPPNRRKNG